MGYFFLEPKPDFNGGNYHMRHLGHLYYFYSWNSALVNNFTESGSKPKVLSRSSYLEKSPMVKPINKYFVHSTYEGQMGIHTVC